MITCDKCGASLQDNAVYCPVCGNRIEQDIDHKRILGADDYGESVSDSTTVLEYGDNTVSDNQQQFYNQNNSSRKFYSGEGNPSAYPDNSNSYAQNNNQNGNNNYGNPPVSDNTYGMPGYNNQPLQPNQQQFNQQQFNQQQFNQQQYNQQQYNQQQYNQQQFNQPPYNGQGMNYSQNDINGKMSYLDFFNSYASKKTKSYITSLGIICIVTCVISLLPVMIGVYISLLDVAFYLAFAVLIFKLKRWYITLPVCIYGGVFTIIGFVSEGSPTGIVALVVSIFATIQLKKLEDAYNNYLSTNQFPMEQI